MTTTPNIPAACRRIGCDGYEPTGLPCVRNPLGCCRNAQMAMVSRGRAFIENQTKALAGSRQADELRALLLHMDEQADMLRHMRSVCSNYDIDLGVPGRRS